MDCQYCYIPASALVPVSDTYRGLCEKKVQWLRDANKKEVFYQKVFLIMVTILIAGTFTTVLKDKKSVRSRKKVEIKVFLNFFAY
jgi:hypothetical protein